MKNYEEFSKEFEKYYREHLKPLIEQGKDSHGLTGTLLNSHELAGVLLKNIALLVENDKDIFNSQDPRTFSSGLGLLASMEMMSDKLMEGTFNPARDFETLESYLNQANSSNTQATLDNSGK